jgi:hypothetical protein
MMMPRCLLFLVVWMLLMGFAAASANMTVISMQEPSMSVLLLFPYDNEDQPQTP